MALVRRMGGSSSISCDRSFTPSLLSAWLVAFTVSHDELALAKILTVRMVLVPNLMKSLCDHLTRSSRRTGAGASSTREMVDPDIGEIISP